MNVSEVKNLAKEDIYLFMDSFYIENSCIDRSILIVNNETSQRYFIDEMHVDAVLQDRINEGDERTTEEIQYSGSFYDDVCELDYDVEELAFELIDHLELCV